MGKPTHSQLLVLPSSSWRLFAGPRHTVLNGPGRYLSTGTEIELVQDVLYVVGNSAVRDHTAL